MRVASTPARFGDIAAIKTIGDQINADGGDDNPERIDLFPRLRAI
jgi:hypothetical protein